MNNKSCYVSTETTFYIQGHLPLPHLWSVFIAAGIHLIIDASHKLINAS